MGFGLGTLGKIFAVGAAPFTGGASLAALPAIDAIGAGLGAASQGMANNRGSKFQGQLDLERLLMDREAQQFNQGLNRQQDIRTSGADAWRKLLASQHLREPGARPQLSPYSVAPRVANEHERIGAEALANEAANRLINGYQGPQVSDRQPNIDPKLLNPGVLERIFGIASPALSLYGAAASPIPSSRASGASSIASGLYSAPRRV